MGRSFRERVVAATWDSKVETRNARGYEPVLREIRQGGKTDEWFFEIMSRGPILDAGSGKGRLVRDLVSDGYDAYGIDIAYRDPCRLAIATGNVPRFEERFLYANAAVKIPFPSDYFQTIIQWAGPLNYAKNPARLIKTFEELSRVLAPGGTMIIWSVDAGQYNFDPPVVWIRNFVFILDDFPRAMRIGGSEAHKASATLLNELEASGRYELEICTRWQEHDTEEDLFHGIGYIVLTKRFA